MDIYLWIKGCIIEFGGKKFNWMREEWRLKQVRIGADEKLKSVAS